MVQRQLKCQNALTSCKLMIKNNNFKVEKKRRKKERKEKKRWFENQTSHKQIIKDDDVKECISIE